MTNLPEAVVAAEKLTECRCGSFWQEDGACILCAPVVAERAAIISSVFAPLLTERDQLQSRGDAGGLGCDGETMKQLGRWLVWDEDWKSANRLYTFRAWCANCGDSNVAGLPKGTPKKGQFLVCPKCGCRVNL